MSQPMAPELVAQLVDPADADLSAGSNKAVQWRCPDDPRHLWSASPNTRRRCSNCPVCLNKIVLDGVNDLATTDPVIATELVDEVVGHQVHRGAHRKVRWSCSEPTHPTWSASVVSRIRLGSGCPYCSGRAPVPGLDDLATTHPDLADTLVDPAEATSLGAGSSKKLLWRCTTDPTHEPWLAPVRNRVGGRHKKPTGCPQCQGRSGRSYERRPTLGELDATVLAQALDPDLVATLSSGSGRQVLWHCDECGHDYSMSVRHKLRGQGCPACAGTLVVAGRNDLATTHPDLAAQLLDQGLATTLSRGSTVFTEWTCSQGHTWSAPVYARVAGNGCPQCSPIGSSYGEQEVLAAVRALDPSAEHRVRLPKGGGHGTEVDILAGSLAVEFNGVFWHSEAAGRDRNTHAAKLAAIRDAGLSLVTIWEDDWADLTRRAVIVRTLAHRLGRVDRLAAALADAGVPEAMDESLTEHLGARTLTPTDISGPEAAAFFQVNHVQGQVRLTRSFALRDEAGRPRAVLGLRSPRHNARAKRSAGLWEIQRYATRGSVPGGFSRLLAHAERTLMTAGETLTGWVTLSADEAFEGRLYDACGFTVNGRVRPTYWYAGGPLRGRRAPKEAFQLKEFRSNDDLVYEEGWSELEAASANRMYRIWDAGKTRWTKAV